MIPAAVRICTPRRCARSRPVVAGDDLRAVGDTVLAEDLLDVGLDRVIRRVLTAWDDGGARNPAITVLRGAFGDPRHARLVQELLEPHLEDLVRTLGAEDVELRAALLMSQLLGLATTRHIFELEPLQVAPRERLVAIHGPLAQGILTGPLPDAT